MRARNLPGVRAGSFNVITDFGTTEKAHDGYLSMDAYWIVAIVRLGAPLSFSRTKMASVTKDVALGAMTRASKALVITDDAVQLQVQQGKRTHTGTMNASLKEGGVNYLVEILPGDHVFAWIVNNRADYLRLLAQVEAGEACNDFRDGLKFVGRVHSIRKQVSVSRDSGTKSAGYQLQGIGFSELEAQFFYDWNLASLDTLQKDLGQWLTRIGAEYQTLFRQSAERGIQQDNAGDLITAFVDLIIGKGPKKDGNISIAGAAGQTATATPQLDNSAPFAYLIPLQVGRLLGVRIGSKADRVMSYADILELVVGIQTYSAKSWPLLFVPDAGPGSGGRRLFTRDKLKGTFIPMLPPLTNTPLWALIQKFLNPAINEAYTCLRVNASGRVMPTMVVRQIPFTTEVFKEKIKTTKFLDLPQWAISATMVSSVDIGRSDATRFNFVHVYGQSASIANNNAIPNQIVQNPPVRDDLDIMRSGLRSYMTTVECFVDEQIGKAPSTWINLVADFTIGSHLTLNGTISCLGIQSPICPGDNLLFDGVVYHIESVSHSAGIDGMGHKSWQTQLQLTNGMRANDNGVGFTDDERGAASGQFPIYPGFEKSDNTFYDPGLSLEQRLTTGGETERTSAAQFDDLENQLERTDGPSQLSPANQSIPSPPAKKRRRRRR